MRHFLRLSYDGTNYRGWQRQKGVRSVQETLERAMTKVIKEPINVIGCGRTDAGVHASDYFAHINTKTALSDQLIRNLNYTLPDSIAVHQYWLAGKGWHARFSATGRTYIYQLHGGKNPFLTRFSTYLPYDTADLDWLAIEKALALLLEQEDFRCLCKAPDRHNHTRCNMSEASLLKTSTNQFSFRFTSNRFLRGMIRIIVAQLLDIGLGKDNIAAFEERLDQQKRPAYFHLAPPQGLSLVKIEYPFID